MLFSLNLLHGVCVFYHLIIIPKYLGKARTIVESSIQELPDDQSAITFYDLYIKDLPLAFDTNTIFEFTVFEGTRQVTVFNMDKPFPIEELPLSEIELAYA